MSIDSGRPDILNDLLALSHVPRWTIVVHVRPQSVAEHSFRATCIFMELALRLDLKIPYEALVWALVHDGPEAWTGDIPGPFKSKDQKAADAEVAPWWAEFRRRVPDGWFELFKVADLIETGTFIERFGIGAYAHYAGWHILNVELPEKVEKVAPMFFWGPEMMMQVTTSLINDIREEKGRCNFS